jgi:hypothetical protein
LSDKRNLAQLMKCFIIAPVHEETPAADELTIRAIGHIRSGKSVKFQALHQPDEHAGETSVLELLPREELRRGLQDLQGFTRIWLIWWFHRNQSWRSLVLPPRGMAKRRGVFATRQLAKRQITWLRASPERRAIPCEAPDALAQVLALARAFARNGDDGCS